MNSGKPATRALGPATLGPLPERSLGPGTMPVDARQGRAGPWSRAPGPWSLLQ
jgi:hypothetical protein